MSRCVLTIAGSDPSGGAGIQNDLKTIAAHGMHGASCMTVVTVQNTTGVVRPSVFLDPSLVEDQILAVSQDLSLSSVKVGLLGNEAISKAVSRALDEIQDVPKVVDPIIKAGTGQDLLSGKALDVLAPVMRHASVITPNVHEAEALSGMKVRNPEEAKVAARAIIEMGPAAVLIKGGHLQKKPFTDVLVTPEGDKILPGRRIETQSTHGSGCTLSTSLACHLAGGMVIEDAAIYAKRFTEEAMKEGVQVGAGNGPVNPLGKTIREAESLRIIEAIARAVRMLEETPGFSRLIPQVGANIAMAPRGVRDLEDVVGLTGRIIRVNGRPRACGCPMRGGSSHMARMAFTLRQKSETLGCCMNIRFSQAILDAGRTMGYSVARFERRQEPEGESTMSWGLARALETSSVIPDLVYDLGATGKEAMVRILGSGPEEVAQKALQIAGAIK